MPQNHSKFPKFSDPGDAWLASQLGISKSRHLSDSQAQ